MDGIVVSPNDGDDSFKAEDMESPIAQCRRGLSGKSISPKITSSVL